MNRKLIDLALLMLACAFGHTVNGARLIAASTEVRNPQKLRYMWQHVCAGLLFNEAGLPFGAFRIEPEYACEPILSTPADHVFN